MLAKMKTPAEGWENNKRRYRSDRGVSICPAGKSGNIAAIKLKAVHRSPLSQENKKEKKKKKEEVQLRICYRVKRIASI